MNKNQLKTLTELALIRAIPDLTIGNLKHGRKKSLFRRLQKAVDIDIKKLPNPSKKELDMIWEKVEAFGKQTGWLHQQKHIGTLISFCLDVTEQSEFRFNRMIVQTLNDIIEYLEAGNDFKYQSCWAGSLAAEKWRELFR